MRHAQPYQIVASAFTVLDIAQEITLSVEATDKSQYVFERFAEIVGIVGDSICLVHSNQQIIGYLTFANDFGTAQSAGELANPITPDQIVPASIPLLDLLPLFEEQFFFFVLERNKITHVVSFIDLDKLPMKLCLFSLFMELESMMLERLTYDFEAEQYISYLPETRLKKAQELCKLKYKTETPERLLFCTTFIDKVNIFQSDETLSKYLPFSSMKESNHFFSILEKMRNQIAHSDSIFSVISSPHEMHSFVAKLNEVISSLSVSEA